MTVPRDVNAHAKRRERAPPLMGKRALWYYTHYLCMRSAACAHIASSNVPFHGAVRVSLAVIYALSRSLARRRRTAIPRRE
jgi:hypothetical protein